MAWEWKERLRDERKGEAVCFWSVKISKAIWDTQTTVLGLHRQLFTRDRHCLTQCFFSLVLHRLDCLTVVFVLAKRKSFAQYRFEQLSLAALRHYNEKLSTVWTVQYIIVIISKENKCEFLFLKTKSEKQEISLQVFNYIQREKFRSAKEWWDFSNA